MKKIINKAFIDTIPVLTGYLVLGFGFGIILKSNGYGIRVALVMSLIIYAGSMQYVAIGLLTSGASLITAALRFLPFVVFNGNRKTPAIIDKLGKVLPYAIMGMLVVYCLKGVSFTSAAGFLPSLMACIVVAGLYIWKRNTLVSIVAGTICYMIPVQVVFV